MNYWRMSFRDGNQGKSVWKDCLERGIAAIDYYDGNGDRVVEDCSKLTKEEVVKEFKKIMPNKPTCRKNIIRIAYKMKDGDIIYAKEGPRIVGKGEIVKEYDFDPEILKDTIVKWAHFLTVDWEEDFPEIEIKLGAEQWTILPLNEERLERIQKKESEIRESREKEKAIEGKKYKSEQTFRSRNRSLINAKKENSDYTCEICGFNFKEKYGDLGEEYIVAHHLELISNRKEPSKTSLDDIVLLCENCHAMIHKENPPLTPKELKQKINK